LSQLRRTLAESNVAAIAICVLLISSFDALYQALADHIEAVAIYILYWISERTRPTLTAAGLHEYIATRMQKDLGHFINAVIYFVLAIIVSRVVFRAGLFTALRNFPNHLRAPKESAEC
jgi:large-conductance mechanosensitive channel